MPSRESILSWVIIEDNFGASDSIVLPEFIIYLFILDSSFIQLACIFK